jgi:hypothetical protein
MTCINAYYRLCDVWFNSRPVELMMDHDIIVPKIMIHLVGWKGFTFHFLYYKPFHIPRLSLRRSHELHEILSNGHAILISGYHACNARGVYIFQYAKMAVQSACNLL